MECAGTKSMKEALSFFFLYLYNRIYYIQHHIHNVALDNILYLCHNYKSVAVFLSRQAPSTYSPMECLGQGRHIIILMSCDQ